MKPQHLLLAAPLSIIYPAVEAYVSTRPQSFVNRQDSLTKLSSSIHIVDNKLTEKSDEIDLSDGFLFPALSIEEAESIHGMPWKDTIGKSESEKPLIYMDFWEWQIDFMKETLTNLRPLDCDLDKYSYNENTDKKARIVSQCYRSDEYRKIRMTYYDAGDNTQVFNSLWYPDPQYNLPVLGIDLLAFNRKKYLAIVDFQPLHDKESDHAILFEERLKSIKDEYDSLKGRMSSKFYDETQFFSQQMLFSRFDDESIISRELFPAYKRYVDLHTKLVGETSSDHSAQGKELVLDRQGAYDTYSAERDPATGLFASMFGKEWADEFVFDFLFSLSEKKEGSPALPPMSGMGGGPPVSSSHAGAKERPTHVRSSD